MNVLTSGNIYYNWRKIWKSTKLLETENKPKTFFLINHNNEHYGG